MFDEITELLESVLVDIEDDKGDTPLEPPTDVTLYMCMGCRNDIT